PAGARRADVRARSQRHSRMGGAAARHRRGHRGRHRGARDSARQGRRRHRVETGMSLRDGGLGLPPRRALPGDIAAAAQLACLLEAHAPKPGNVFPGRDFADVGYDDFVASAAAIGAPFSRLADTPLGVLVREAVEATTKWAPSNTNLGIVLLLAPL